MKFAQLTTSQRDSLMTPFKEGEVREVTLIIWWSKNTGPNGFAFKFIISF